MVKAACVVRGLPNVLRLRQVCRSLHDVPVETHSGRSEARRVKPAAAIIATESENACCETLILRQTVPQAVNPREAAECIWLLLQVCLMHRQALGTHAYTHSISDHELYSRFSKQRTGECTHQSRETGGGVCDSGQRRSERSGQDVKLLTHLGGEKP